MKNSKKDIIRRIQVLFNNALLNAKNNPELAERQAQIAKKISMKFKLRCRLRQVLVFVKTVKNSCSWDRIKSTIR